MSTRRVPDAQPMPVQRSAGTGGRGRAALVTVATFAVAGVLVGLVWPRLAPSVEMVMTTVGPMPATEQAATELMAMDAWYAFLSGGVALLVGATLGAVYLRHGVSTVLALFGGAALAAVMAVVAGTLSAGGQILLAWEPEAPVSTELTAPLMLHAPGVLLIWPIAALAPALLLAWLGWEERSENFSADAAR